jgi:hypothetical protein
MVRKATLLLALALVAAPVFAQHNPFVARKPRLKPGVQAKPSPGPQGPRTTPERNTTPTENSNDSSPVISPLRTNKPTTTSSTAKPKDKGQSERLFSDDERNAIMGFWAKEGRYVSMPPDDATQKGLWQVRLSVPGSIWFREYNRARKVSAPPTQNAKPQTPEQEEWEKWVVQKLNRDRWEAFQQAKLNNKKMFNVDAPAADKTIPATEPPRPGPIPRELLALVKINPPAFAEAVVPMSHVIAFDDITLTYRDNVRLSNPRYLYYRFEKGVNSEGISMKSMSRDQINRLFKASGMSGRESRVMRAVSELEGGFDAVNTYDTGYVSVGFIQFATLAEGDNSLGSFLASYKRDDPDNFNRDMRAYGIDVTSDGKLAVLDPVTGAELSGSDATLKTVSDRRLIAIFQRAGLKSDAFNAAQIRSAKAQFWPEFDNVSVELASGKKITGRVSDFVKSEAGIATLMDRKVNTGNIAKLASVLDQLAPRVRPTSMADYAPYEGEIIRLMTYRRNFLEDPELSKPGGVAGREPSGPSRVVPPSNTDDIRVPPPSDTKPKLTGRKKNSAPQKGNRWNIPPR